MIFQLDLLKAISQIAFDFVEKEKLKIMQKLKKPLIREENILPR